MPGNNCKGTSNADFVECARFLVHLTRKQIYHHCDYCATTFKHAKNIQFMDAGDVTLGFE